MQELLRRMWADESGQDLVEYALLVFFISIASIAVLTILGPQIAGVFGQVSAAL